MNEKQLLRISLSIAIIGIVALFFLAQNIEADIVEIDTITDEFIDQKVTVNGEIKELKVLDDMTMITVKGEISSILVVVFEPLNDLEVGNDVLVSGTVKDYKGKLEIVADRVEIK